MKFGRGVAALAAALCVACGGGGGIDGNAGSPGHTQSPDGLAVSDIRVETQEVVPVVKGGNPTYQFVVTNAGPHAAKSVAVEVSADDFVVIDSLTCAAQAGVTCPASTGTVMTIPSMAVGSSVTFELKGRFTPSSTGIASVTLRARAPRDGVSANDSARSIASESAVSTVHLQSDSKDFIGQGQAHAYNSVDNTFVLNAVGNVVSIVVHGQETWYGDFALPSALAKVTPGTYAGLTRHPFHVPAVGGLSWRGEGRGCNELTGSMIVKAATYDGDTLQTLDLDFEQHCEGQASALRGQIHWVRTGPPVTAIGPINPVPPHWQMPAGVAPNGNFVYLQSEPGDYVGQGETSVLPATTYPMVLTATGSRIDVEIGGWRGAFAAKASLPQLQPGYYPNLTRYPFHDTLVGGLDWSGNGRGCNKETGWFIVDKVIYDGATLKAIDLRFEQKCENSIQALRGHVHWAL